MELIKTSENYSISDKKENWVVTGSVSSETKGSLNLNVSVNLESGEHIGSFSYSRWEANSNVNINYSVSEENRDALVAYSDTLIDWVLEQFNA